MMTITVIKKSAAPSILVLGNVLYNFFVAIIKKYNGTHQLHFMNLGKFFHRYKMVWNTTESNNFFPRIIGLDN